MGKPFTRKPITDADALKNARRLAELAGPHLDEAVETVLKVMRDPNSRQRLSAAGMIADWSTRGEEAQAEANANGNVRILVVQSNDMDAIERSLMAEAG